MVWFDIILNSPFVVRCLATFAEISFIGGISVILLRFCKEMGVRTCCKAGLWLSRTPFLAIIAIILAQPLAFMGLITQHYVWFFIEEALWALAFLSITPLVLYSYNLNRKQEVKKTGYTLFLSVTMIWCIGYLIFQCFFALPFMYFPEIAKTAGNVIPPNAIYVSIFDYTVVRDFHSWGGIGFIIWHSGYFSVCSWMNLIYMSAPRKRVLVRTD